MCQLQLSSVAISGWIWLWVRPSQGTHCCSSDTQERMLFILENSQLPRAQCFLANVGMLCPRSETGRSQPSSNWERQHGELGWVKAEVHPSCAADLPFSGGLLGREPCVFAWYRPKLSQVRELRTILVTIMQTETNSEILWNNEMGMFLFLRFYSFEFVKLHCPFMVLFHILT